LPYRFKGIKDWLLQSLGGLLYYKVCLTAGMNTSHQFYVAFS